jgi:hypothetical protein
VSLSVGKRLGIDALIHGNVAGFSSECDKQTALFAYGSEPLECQILLLALQWYVAAGVKYDEAHAAGARECCSNLLQPHRHEWQLRNMCQRHIGGDQVVLTVRPICRPMPAVVKEADGVRSCLSEALYVLPYRLQERVLIASVLTTRVLKPTFSSAPFTSSLSRCVLVRLAPAWV